MRWRQVVCIMPKPTFMQDLNLLYSLIRFNVSESLFVWGGKENNSLRFDFRI